MSRRRSRDYGHFLDIQGILTNYLSESVRPTLQKLQERHFGIHYDFVNSYQKDMVRRALGIGRKYSLERWISYTNGREFQEDIADIIENYPELIEKELASEEYKDYLEFILNPNLPSDRKQELLDANIPAIAVLFNNKVVKYSKLKENLVINTLGRGARWYLPTYWEWCTREDKLLIRKYVTLLRGISRIEQTKTLMAPATQEVIEQIEATPPSLGYRAVWKCVYCGEYCAKTTSQCPSCGNPKEEDF